VIQLSEQQIIDQLALDLLRRGRGVDAGPRLEIGHLDETNRSGHRMRQGVLTQFSAPQMDMDFEKLQ